MADRASVSHITDDMASYAKVLASWRDENITADRIAPGGCATARERAAAYRMALGLLHDVSGGEVGEALDDQPSPYRTPAMEETR